MVKKVCVLLVLLLVCGNVFADTYGYWDTNGNYILYTMRMVQWEKMATYSTPEQVKDVQRRLKTFAYELLKHEFDCAPNQEILVENPVYITEEEFEDNVTKQYGSNWLPGDLFYDGVKTPESSIIYMDFICKYNGRYLLLHLVAAYIL